jgi:hypothetical protein
MFGLFGKSGFEAEKEELEKKFKGLGSEMMVAMNSFQIQKQMNLLTSMINVCDELINCCKKHGKFEEMKKWEAHKAQAINLRG